MHTNCSAIAPQSESELLQRARALAGLTLAQLGERHGQAVPDNLRRNKGWVGQLLERALGATASSRAEPDFQVIGVEMKTLPVDRRGRPRESTYVCTVPLEAPSGQSWENCWLRQKLRRVLWVPVAADRGEFLGSRQIGMPLLWSPSPEEEILLRRDWEELMEMVCLGELEQITARHGEVLQMRPKAANSRVLCTASGTDGSPIATNPRGFYLRTSFTAAILQRHYALSRSDCIG